MLNPELYDWLQETFVADVEVSGEDRPGSYSFRAAGKRVNGKLTSLRRAPVKSSVNYAHVNDWGEVYHLNCPVCGDTKRRLYVGHLCGSTLIQETKTKTKKVKFSKSMYLCHNEKCDLWEYFKEIPEFELDGSVQVKKVKNTLHIPVEMDIPQGCIPLSKAPDEALEYLSGRGYDIRALEDEFLVHYAPAGTVWRKATDTEPEKAFYKPRIVVPIVNRCRWVNWQARALSDTDKPKWLFPGGSAKSECIYNLDEIWKYQTLALVEGITDTWAYGNDEETAAGGLFGKYLSDTHLHMLSLLFKHKGRVCVVLDSAAEDPSTEKASKENVEKLMKLDAFPGGVAELRLPDKDPGSYTATEGPYTAENLRQMVKEATYVQR